MNIYTSIHHAIRKRKLFGIWKYENEDYVRKRWMHVQALMRFVNESVKDHINRIRHGLLSRTRKVETAGPHSVRVSETDHGLTIHYFYKNQENNNKTYNN